MLLLNQGMMQFIKHPFHRNDLSNVSLYYIEAYNQELTEQQINTLNSLNATFNVNTALAPLRSGKTTILSTSSNFGRPSKRSHGNLSNKVIFRESEINSTYNILAAGEIRSLAVVVFSDPNNFIGRYILVFSVGLPGSGADIEMEKVDYVVGERIKLNDIVINIQNLLGET